MRDYINNYENIRNTFVMDDRKYHEFDPKSDTFSKDALEYALKHAFRDFNFRTLTAVKSDKETGFVCGFDEWVKNQKNAKKTAKSKAEKDAVSEKRTDYLMEQLSKSGFYKRFEDYFISENAYKTKDGFNTWHNETCKVFLESLKDDYKDLCYGKAQKIVNMMFKHLYCLDGAEKYAEDGYFTYCHLTLDSFTLEWFKRNVNRGKVGVWSNLYYNDSDIDINNYCYYVDKIHEYFSRNDIKEKYNGLTPFLFEFYMWPEMQLHLASEGFYFALKENLGDKCRENFRSKNIDDKIDEIYKAVAERTKVCK